MTTEQNPSPTPPPEGEGVNPSPPSLAGKGALGSPPSLAGVGGGGFNLRPVLVLLGVFAVATAGFAVWYFAIRTPPTDLDLLQGDWQVSVRDRETQNVIQVKGDRWQSVANGVAAREYRVSLNPAANPKEIDLEALDVENVRGPRPNLHGIYALDSDQPRVRLAPATEPRPTTFDDPDANVLTLTKVKLEPVPQKRK